MRISKLKLKWKWIKFWGHRYIIMSPNNVKKQLILYHRIFYDIDEWNAYFIKNERGIK